MKTIITAIVALVGATLVAATGFPANMPECGKICGNNMLAQAAQLGCQALDIACLCRNPDFGYGIHDCSVQACSDVSEANIVIGWGNDMCASAGVPANIESATAIETPGPATSVVVSTVSNGSSTFVTSSTITLPAESPTVTTTFSDVFTSGSVTLTLTGETTFVLPSPTDQEPSSLSSSGLGAQVTGAPALGVLAVAGVAAALL